MMRRRCTHVLLATGLLLALGCVSVKHSPPARFFVLRAVAEAPATQTTRGVTGIVGILPVELPDHLVRSQMVTWASDNEVRLEEFARWAEPLNVGVTRVVRENLVTLLPDHRFLDYPWKSADSMRCRVQVEVRFFGLQADGTVRLDGRSALLPSQSDEPLRVEPFVLRGEPVETENPQAVVQSMSQLLAEMCDGLAHRIRNLPAPGASPSGY
jgi:uncharacterized lipoprotein YmbA